MAYLPCIGDTKSDLAAIRELLLTLECGIEERNTEKYVSVFSEDEYVYISDMTTPDDPSDDIYLSGAESERRVIDKIRRHYDNLDLEMTEPIIKLNGNSAEVRNEMEVVFSVFERPDFPEIYCAVSYSTFYLRKSGSKWKIIRWQQHEMSPEDMAARTREKNKDKEVADLIRDLGADRMVTWANALSELRRARATATDSIIEALNSPSKNIRLRSTWLLACMSDESAIEALIEVLENEKEDMDVRAAAANALMECDGQIVDKALFIASGNGNPKLKAAASIVLAQRIRKRMDYLYQNALAGLRHRDETVRRAATESLGIIMSVQGADLLEQRAKDRNETENVRLAALESLKQLRSESASLIFRDILKDGSESVDIRIQAAKALAEVQDPKALELMIDIAKDERGLSDLRREVIEGLGAFGSSRATKPLLDFLISSDAVLRHKAIESLGIIADRRALKPLMMLLMSREENESIRRLAGKGIVKIDRDLAFGPLAQIVKDKTESAPARRMAAEELAQSGDTRSIPLLIEVLKDKQQPWWLRQVAANCLCWDELFFNHASSICVEALKVAMGDSNEKVARAAQDALQTINSRPKP